MAGFRVNRRIRVAKGLTINVAKSGLSTSAKVGKVTVNSRRGATVNVAKGVSYNVPVSKPKTTRKAEAVAVAAAPRTAAASGPRVFRRPLGLPGWAFWTIGITAAVLLGAIPFVGAFLLLGVFATMMAFWLSAPKRIHNGTKDGRAITAGSYLPLGEGGDVAVVGEQFYQEALRWLSTAVESRDNVTFALVPEPTNPHDSNAVRIDAVHAGQQYTVGYLSADVAGAYQQALLPLAKHKAVGTVTGKVWGVDQNAANLQVYLRLSGPAGLFPSS